MAPGITPWLSALINWARAQILWKIYLYKNHQNLWCGPPPDSGLVQLGAAAPDSADLQALLERVGRQLPTGDRKSTRLNSSHLVISYAVFCLKKKKRTTLTLVCNPHQLHSLFSTTALDSVFFFFFF